MQRTDKNDRTLAVADVVLIRGTIEELDDARGIVKVRLSGTGTGTQHPQPNNGRTLIVGYSDVERT